jgi:hypothetical protein
MKTPEIRALGKSAGRNLCDYLEIKQTLARFKKTTTILIIATMKIF